MWVQVGPAMAAPEPPAAPAANASADSAAAASPTPIITVAGAAPVPETEPVEGSGLRILPLIADPCLNLTLSPWPRTPVARRTLLHRFEVLRPGCIRQPLFLAALGALWLDEGEPAQALVWLERALLLDPDHLGAQADHALALAALGEPAGRDALVERWKYRSDVPPALRERLAQSLVQVPQGTAVVGLRPANTVEGWVFYREVTSLLGYESNLDHSPRLSELTLTLPDGPIAFPVDSKPRKGSAAIVDLSAQLAYSPRTGMIVQTGLQGSARRATSASDSDWHHLQWAGSASQQWGPWRGQAGFNATWVGGESGEPYRLTRLSAAADREAIGCSHRVAVETESRRHKDTRGSDSRTTGAAWSSQCPWNGSGWVWGLSARFTVDTPSDPTRPGGDQHQSSLGLRASGPLGARVRMDVSLRGSALRDSVGYSPLLENNAIRHLNQSQVSLELTRPFEWRWLAGAEGLFQMQAVRQSSNLPIFRYEGVSAYGGLRWRW